MAGRRLTPVFTENFAKNLDVAFLAVKHHRQLSFDLHGFWP